MVKNIEFNLILEPQDTTRLQEHTHSEPHMTHNIGITLLDKQINT